MNLTALFCNGKPVARKVHINERVFYGKNVNYYNGF